MLKRKLQIGSGMASLLFSTMILTGMAYADSQLPNQSAETPAASQTVPATTPRAASGNTSTPKLKNCGLKRRPVQRPGTLLYQ